MSTTLYVPLVRTKQGEMYGLRDLDTSIKAHLMPLLDISRRQSSLGLADVRMAIDKNLNGLPKVLNGVHDVFVDSSELDPNLRLENGVHPLRRLADILAETGKRAIPVSGLARDNAHWNAVAEIATVLSDGAICIRIEDYDLETPTESTTALSSALRERGFTPEKTTLIFDLRDVYDKDPGLLASRVVAFINMLTSTSFVRMVIAGCGIPGRLSQAVKTREVSYLPRVEKSVYQAVTREIQGYGNFCFGDYTTVNPVQEELEWYIVQNTMGPKAIYTLSDSWFVIRGGSFKRHPRKRLQYFDIAKEIQKLQEFAGENFSAGDKYIVAQAAELGKPGSPRTWITACVTHHITHTVRELLPS